MGFSELQGTLFYGWGDMFLETNWSAQYPQLPAKPGLESGHLNP